VARRQVVEHDDLVALVEQRTDHVRPHVARSPRDERSHADSPRP
jgi:hypothetical protein